MSREFSALVLAGSAIGGTGSSQNDSEIGHTTGNNIGGDANNNNNNYLGRIGEDEEEETNPLAIVPDNYNHLTTSPTSRRREAAPPSSGESGGDDRAVASVQRVKKEEVESKISAWQNAKVAKINNRFKREDAVINGWEGEQVHKATSWMKKVEVRRDFVNIYTHIHTHTYICIYTTLCFHADKCFNFYF